MQRTLPWLVSPCREIRFRERENGGTKPTGVTETDENSSGQQRAGEKSDSIASQLSRDFTTLAPFSVQ